MVQEVDERLERLLVQSPETDYGQAIYTKVAHALESAQFQLNNKAIISDANPEKDWRYWKGQVKALEQIIKLPEEAKKALTKL